MFQATIGEVAQKRIPGAQRKKSQSGRLFPQRLWEETIDDFIGSTISADGDKMALSSRVSVAGYFCSVSGSAGRRDFDIEAGIPQALQRRAEEFPAASAARGGIHDG